MFNKVRNNKKNDSVVVKFRYINLMQMNNNETTVDTVNQLLYICERENILRFARAPSLWIFLALTSPCRTYDCNNNTGLFKAYSQKLVVENQFVCSKSWNNVVWNKSWFTVHIQVIYGPHIVYNHHLLNLIGWELQEG